MSNTIYTKQNLDRNQKLIVAQHYVYKKAKFIALVLFLMSVVIPIGLNISLIWIKNDIVIAAFSFVSICFVFMCDMLRNILSAKKSLAALVQQKFDMNVFELKNGFCFDEEIVNMAEEKYGNKNWPRKKNWYPDYRKLERNKAIYYCQKENIDWSNNLSSKYVVFLAICFFTMVFISIINFIIVDCPISHIISFLLIALPLLTYCCSGYIKIKNDKKALNDIQSYANKLETIIEQNGVVEEEMLENLQWMLFSYRKNKYLIPDWFDRFFYKEIEKYELNKAKKRRNK